MSNNPNQLSSSQESDPRKDRSGRLSAKMLLRKLINREPSLESRISATTGPFIEVGSVPSNPRRQSLIDLSKIDKPLITSNIYQPETIETGYRHRLTGEPKTVAHRDDAPNPRWYRATGADFKTVRRPDSWLTDPVLDKIDFIGDATNLPVQDGSVGALYATGLLADAEPAFISDEAPRTLETGGLLVVDGVKAASLVNENPYFDTIKSKSRRSRTKGSPGYAAIRNDVPYKPPVSDPNVP